MSQMTDKRATLIIGPHRSGTSVVAKAVESAGYHLGCDLLEPSVENPKGFFESVAVNTFNDRLLHEIGLCWDYLGFVSEEQASRLARAPTSLRGEASELVESVFASEPKLAIKDPRLCILEPFWSSVLEELGYRCSCLLVIRHPLESALSQCKRFSAEESLHLVGSNLSEGVQLWATYLLQALKNLSGKNPHVVDYASLLANPASELGNLQSALGTPSDVLDRGEFCETFLEKDLNRSSTAAIEGDVRERFAPYIKVYEQILSSFDRCRGMAPGLLEDAAHGLTTALERDPTLPENQLALYVRARHAALGRALELRWLKQELQHAGNIIRYNEDLIERLGSVRGATDETE